MYGLFRFIFAVDERASCWPFHLKCPPRAKSCHPSARYFTGRSLASGDQIWKDPPHYPLLFVATPPTGEIFREVKATFNDLEARYTFPRRSVSMGYVTSFGFVCLVFAELFVPTQNSKRRGSVRCCPTARSASIQSGSTARGSLHIFRVIKHDHIFPVVLVGTDIPYTNPSYFLPLADEPPGRDGSRHSGYSRGDTPG